MALNVLQLPPPVPKQMERPTQHDIPETKELRDAIQQQAIDYLRGSDLVPPLSMEDLQVHAKALSEEQGIEERFQEFTRIEVSPVIALSHRGENRIGTCFDIAIDARCEVNAEKR